MKTLEEAMKQGVLDQRNSAKQGDVGMGAATHYFAAYGYTVCIPLTDSQSYDLVIDCDDPNVRPYRVQVKTTRYQNERGAYVVELRTKGGNRSRQSEKRFDATGIDFVFVLTNDSVSWCLPADQLHGNCSVTLGAKWKQYICGKPVIPSPDVLYADMVER